MVELDNLSNEDFGTLVRSLYTSGEPGGHLTVIYRLLKDEYDRVNQSREEGLAKRREASAKGVLARTGSLPDLPPEVTPQVNRTQTRTQTSTQEGTELGKPRVLKASEVGPFESLMNGNFLE